MERMERRELDIFLLPCPSMIWRGGEDGKRGIWRGKNENRYGGEREIEHLLFLFFFLPSYKDELELIFKLTGNGRGRQEMEIFYYTR
jgi:hypothetical protein